MARKQKNKVIGERFGNYVVLYKRFKTKRGVALYSSKCVFCKKVTLKQLSCLEKSKNSSMQHRCACSLGDKHGRAQDKTYNSWRAMRQRCTNTSHESYKYYGGSGILISKRWKSYNNFYEDMGKRPAGLFLDRIDNKRGYSKNNCKWSSMIEQCNNRRNSVFVEVDGETKTIAQWCVFYKITKSSVDYYTGKKGLTNEKALLLLRNRNN